MSRRLRQAICLWRRAHRSASMTCGRSALGRALAGPATAGSCGNGSVGRVVPRPETPAGRLFLPASLAAFRAGRSARSGMLLCSWELTPMAAAGAAELVTRRTGGLWKEPRAWCLVCSGQVWRGRMVRGPWRIFLVAWQPFGGGQSRTRAFAMLWPRWPRMARRCPPLGQPLTVVMPLVQPPLSS